MRSLLIFILTLCSSALFAGGWLQGKDKGYFKLNQSVIQGNQFYNGNGEVIDIITVGIYQTSAYLEYGVSNKFDLVAYFPFFSRNILNKAIYSSGVTVPGDELNAIGDANLGIKYGIRQNKRTVLSASLMLGIPSGNSDGGESGILQTGDGEFNQLITVEMGHSFNSKWYGNLGAGINFRTKGFSEEWRVLAEVGFMPTDKWLLALKMSSVNSFMNGEALPSAGNGIFSNNMEFFSVGPEIAYRFGKSMGVSVAYFGAFSGQFILAEPAYNAGFFWILGK